MKLKIPEKIAIIVLSALISYSAATRNDNLPFTESGEVHKRVLKEDSTVILVDILPVCTKDRNEYSYDTK
jgi:hypothetical protein